MTPTTLLQGPHVTDDGYAKVAEFAATLNRHERTVRGYIRLLHEDFGHPDFLEKLDGRSLSPRQQRVLTELARYKTQRTPDSQIRDFLMSDCSLRLTLTEACNWLGPPHFSYTARSISSALQIMKLNQLADQLHAKTIGLIAITKALEFTDLPNAHGGTPVSPVQAEQITAVFRYMRDRQIVEPTAAIAQMQTAEAASTEQIAVNLRASVVDELCHRYPEGSMSDRILRLLGAVQSFEQMYSLRLQPTALIAPIQTTTPQ